MKKIIALLAALVLCCGYTAVSAQEATDVRVYQSFDGKTGPAALGYSDPADLTERIDFSYENGALKIGTGDAASGCTFYLDMECACRLSDAGVKGTGFYIENHTSFDVSINIFLVGQACYIWGGSSVTVVLPDGTVAERDMEDSFLWIEPGFKGYVMCELDQLYDVWTGSGFSSSKDVARVGIYSSYLEALDGEYLIVDNFFTYGKGIENNWADYLAFNPLNPQEVSATATPTASPTAEFTTEAATATTAPTAPQATATVAAPTNTPAQQTPAQSGVIWFIAAAAVVVCGIVVCVLITRKKH